MDPECTHTLQKNQEAANNALRNRPVRAKESDTASLPRYTIDLSLPPAKRYQHVAADFKKEITSLPALFDDVIEGLGVGISMTTVHRVARLLLRRVHDKEQNEELRGIQEITGIQMYLLVAFNVLLDLFMGCTSGGIRVKPPSGDTRMIHFRTLDWGMDPLRKVVAQFDFVEKPGGLTVATSITYVGFVGILTGVRKGLSVSLNFRPNHDVSTRTANFRFYFHHLLVLLGVRPSISSLLRNSLLPCRNKSGGPRSAPPSIALIERQLPSTVATAAYLIFSDGKKTVIMEKDHRTAVVRSATDFIAITNHDEAEELAPQEWDEAQSRVHAALQWTGMEGLIEDSKSRKDCAAKLWKRSAKESADGKFVPQDKVIKWIKKYPITNEETHYAVIMDATEGKIVWIKRHTDHAY